MLSKGESNQFISQEIPHFGDENLILSHPSICNSAESVFLTGGYTEGFIL